MDLRPTTVPSGGWDRGEYSTDVHVGDGIGATDAAGIFYYGVCGRGLDDGQCVCGGCCVGSFGMV